jgi:hypothetical protein
MGAIAKDIIEVSSRRSIFGTLLLRVKPIKSGKLKIIRGFAGGCTSAQATSAGRLKNYGADSLVRNQMRIDASLTNAR